MTVEKKTIRSDIPGHRAFLSNPAQDADAQRLTVARSIALNGEIGSCQHLVVEGAVQAGAFRARRLDVAEPGSFTGTAEVQDAVIAGKFDGRLTVLGRLSIRSTARVTGEISYGTLEAESGARIEGRLTVLPQNQRPPAPEKPALPDNVENLFDGRDTEEDGDESEGGKAGPAPRTGGFRRAAGF